MSPAAPSRLRFDHRESGFGLGTDRPRLSWQIPTADAGFVTASYEIEHRPADGPSRTHSGDGAEQVLLDWPFDPLTSRARGQIRVRVTGSDQDWSPWSEPADYEVSLLRTDDWTARFIAPTGHGAPADSAPVLTTSFELDQPVRSARLYSTALGLSITQVNGRRAGDEHLAPGWTAYDDRLRVATLDVTDLVTEGSNSISVLLGNGWYRGNLGFVGQTCLYGDRLAALVQLEIEQADGRKVISSDASWASHGSEIIANDLYHGTDIDATITEFATGGVEVIERDLGTLVHPQGPPVRETGQVAAIRVWRSPSGKQLVDFGQNLVGWVQLTARGVTAGTTITVRHAEVLEHEELGTRPLRSARATDTFVVTGAAEQVLHPVFTFHGFRYAEITGVDVSAADVTAVVLGTDLERTGWFESSEPDLNQLHENVVWGMRGNFLDVPTDCPQRDERLGWTGDIEVFSPTASFLFDCAGFLSSWLRDLAADQLEDGSVPYVIPDVLKTPTAVACAWGDAATVVPTVLHERFADVGVLATQFDSMKAWTDKIAELAGEDRLWTGGFQFGDWLDPDAPPDDAAAAKADPDVLATAYLYRSADLTAAAAKLLGRDDDHGRYAALAAAVRAAYNRAYVTDGGRIVSDATTAYAQALCWGLLESEERVAGAGDRLADLVRRGGFRVSTGFIGTPLITDALTVAGHVDLAYRLLLERGNPSWLYPVTMGATTIWERWDSMLPDGTINPGEMTSFNHYALGAVADWMHRTVAGLAPAEPGYRRILVAPQLAAGLDHAKATHLTPYGLAEAGWARVGETIEVSVTVPVGSTAEVRLPDGSDPITVGHGSHHWTVGDPVRRPGHPATVRELVDHPTLLAEVADLFGRHGVETDPASLTKRLGPYLDRDADEAVESMRTFRPEVSDNLHREIGALIRG